MKTLTYLPVNWVNGLKLTSQHFFANQYCQTEALNREAGRSLTSYNYGLGEVLEGIGDNLEIEISGDTMSTLCVRLKSCNAITKGGLPIVYYDGLYGDEKFTRYSRTNLLPGVSAMPLDVMKANNPPSFNNSIALTKK